MPRNPWLLKGIYHLVREYKTERVRLGMKKGGHSNMKEECMHELPLQKTLDLNLSSATHHK